MSNIAIIGTRSVDSESIDVLFLKVKSLIARERLEVDRVYSGNAVGTDQVASRFGDKTVLFLPWRSYNAALITNQTVAVRGDDTRYDGEIKKLFPWIEKASCGTVALIRRNAFIVLGDDFYKPADVVFWHTADGSITGGTAYGVKLAMSHRIKLINF